MYACDAPGDYEMDVRFLSPSGAGLARQVARCELGIDGVGAVIPVETLLTSEHGVHVFEIGLDGRLLTKVRYAIEIRETALA